MVPEAAERTFSLVQLAEQSGCPPRTIRYYIARGLLPPPRKAGPGAHYGLEHLERLEQIRRWQAEGLTLAEIGRRLAAPATVSGQEPMPTAWWCYSVSPEVRVYVRADLPPWRARLVRRAIGELTRLLTVGGNGKEENDACENNDGSV